MKKIMKKPKSFYIKRAKQKGEYEVKRKRIRKQKKYEGLLKKIEKNRK